MNSSRVDARISRAADGRSGFPVTGVLLGAAAACILALLFIESDRLLLLNLVALAATLLEVALLWTRSGGFHPAIVPVVLINGVCVLGADIYPEISRFAAVSAVLPIGAEPLERGIELALLFTAALTLGAWLLGARTTKVRTVGDGPSFRTSALVLASVVPLFLAFLGKGSAFWRAADYGVSTGVEGALKVGFATAPVSELALALLLCQQRRPGSSVTRLLGFLGLAAWGLLHFSAASRQLALLPGIVLIGYLLSPSDQPREVRTRWLVVVGAVTLWFSSIALSLRGNPAGVGLLPLSEAAANGRIGTFEWRSVVGNLLFSAPLTGETSRRVIEPSAFWVSINPLPGGWTDWPLVSRTLRVNAFTPFNGLGELGAHGWPYVVAYGLGSGALLSVAMKSSRRFRGSWGLALTATTIAVSTLFTLTMLQYNLRSATRLLYYLAVALLAVRLLAKRTSEQDVTSSPR